MSCQEDIPGIQKIVRLMAPGHNVAKKHLSFPESAAAFS
jgi:hypothetical protein